MKNPTIKEIAKITGVSIATVSRVLNGLEGGYREETKRKIVDVAGELGYRKNMSAATLVSNESKTLGIIMPEYATTFYGEVIQGIEDKAYECGYNVILTHAGVNGNRLKEGIFLMQDRRVDGFIIFSLDLKRVEIELIKMLKIPCILISADTKKNDFPFVKVDDEQAMYDSTDFMIRNNHKKLALVGLNVHDRIAGISRISGYRKCLKNNNLNFSNDDIYPGDYGFDSGKMNMKLIIKQSKKYDGIICASDEVAMGVIAACYDFNIRIPEDLSVIGYDNSSVARMSTPPLTTISQPFYEMGSEAVVKLIQFLKDNIEFCSKIMPHKIIERGSVKCK